MAPRGTASQRYPALAAEILMLTLGWAGGLVALWVLFGLGLPTPDEHPWLGLLLGTPTLTAVAALIYWSVANWGSGGRADAALVAFGTEGTPTRPWVAVAVGSVAALVGSSLISIATQLLGIEVEEQAQVVEVLESGDVLAIGAIAVAALVVAPILEEIIFRRLLFRRLWERVSPAVGYTVSASIFALIHNNLPGLGVYLWLGLVFAHVYAKTGRLWVAIAVHAANNIVTFAVLLWA